MGENGLLDEVAGGIEFVHKAMSIKMLHHKRFEGYPLKDVDEALRKDGPNARVALENCGINELVVDVKYCGIRRYVHPSDHISHLSLKDRKELAQLLDADSQSNLSSLSEQLGVGSAPVENEDTGPSGFTDVISKSETDQYLSQCALQPDVRAKELIEALERINRFDAANVVSRWLSSVHLEDQALEMHKTRGESSSSVSSRRRGTSGASEHCEMRTRSNGGSNLSEGSSPLGSRYSLNSAREPCTCACPRHRFDSSEYSLPFSRDARASSYDSASHVASGPVQRLVNSEHKTRSSSLPSEHSCPTEESYCGSLTERLSCEESQINSTEQIVPQPRLFVDPCRNCEHCAPKLPVQETKGPKSCHSVQEMSNDRHTNRRDADLDFMSSPFQIAHNGVDEEFSKEESFATAETGEPDVKSRFPPSSVVPELSSRLSVSWRPVAFDLGFRRSQLGRFEESSLLRVQANQMLNFWLSNNSCSLGCRHCEEVILERLGEAFENAHRADLKDFLDNSKET